MIFLTEINHEIWNEYWPKIRHAPLLQSWEYGEAKCKSQRFCAKRFLLHHENKKPVGLVQVLEYPLPLIGSLARINRGPILFPDSLNTSSLSREDMAKIIDALRRTAKQERWRMISMIPEFHHGKCDDETVLKEHKFIKMATPSVASATIDLTRTLEEIRISFDGKWRNMLNKSEKIGLELESPSLDESFSYLIPKYQAMQTKKEFKGISTTLLRAIVNQKGPTWSCNILFARRDNERHGAVMVVGHGDTCTYLIGWTSDDGRQLKTNYFLLWQAMLLMREKGYSYFDVGGLSSCTPTGIEHFKKKLKGEEYSLIGEYTYSSISFLHRFLK